MLTCQLSLDSDFICWLASQSCFWRAYVEHMLMQGSYLSMKGKFVKLTVGCIGAFEGGRAGALEVEGAQCVSSSENTIVNRGPEWDTILYASQSYILS